MCEICKLSDTEYSILWQTEQGQVHFNGWRQDGVLILNDIHQTLSTITLHKYTNTQLFKNIPCGNII